jgi:hypothetical protein
MPPGSGSSGMILGTESAGALEAGLSGGLGIGGRGALAAWAGSDSMAGPPARVIPPVAGPAAGAEAPAGVVVVLAAGLVMVGCACATTSLVGAARPATSASVMLEQISRAARDQFSESLICLYTGDLPRSIRHWAGITRLTGPLLFTPRRTGVSHSKEKTHQRAQTPIRAL